MKVLTIILFVCAALVSNAQIPAGLAKEAYTIIQVQRKQLTNCEQVKDSVYRTSQAALQSNAALLKVLADSLALYKAGIVGVKATNQQAIKQADLIRNDLKKAKRQQLFNAVKSAIEGATIVFLTLKILVK